MSAVLGEGYREKILEKIPQISERGEVIRLSESEEVPDGENDKVIEHNIPLYGAGAGSPLLNANREVVGINVFQEGMVPYAVQIYHIRKALDTFEIPYKRPEAMAEGEKQTEKHTEQAEKRAKKDLVKKLDSLENRENQNRRRNRENRGDTGCFRRNGSHDLDVSAYKSEKACREERSKNATYIPTDADIKKGRYDKWMEGQKADIRLEEGKEKKRENGIWRNI